MRVGIIGSGPAGISCALKLAESNIDVEIFEIESQVGGLAKSIELWDQTVDLGPHRFFSMDKKVTDFWLKAIGKDYVDVDRHTSIFYNNNFFQYPLKPKNALSKLGMLKAANCLASYAKSRLFPVIPENNFEEWVSNRFGKKLYEIFFKTYSEKLWGIPCTDLDIDFASQRIKGLNLYEAIKNAIFGGKNNKHKTLVDHFLYPKNGSGQVYSKMADKISVLGGKIHLNSKVIKVLTSNNSAKGFITSDDQKYLFDSVVSTMPLTDLILMTEGIDDTIRDLSKVLSYRNTIIVYLLIDKNSIFKDNWIYIHSNELSTGRVTNFQNWSPYLTKGDSRTILALEYWSNDQDNLWSMTDSELIKLAGAEMSSTGLISTSDIQNGEVVRLHRSYPIYSCGYRQILSKLQKTIDSIANLYAIGRNGSFKYNNQDHSILMGMLTADNIVDNKNYNLWAINTDYDYHEGKDLALSGRP